VKEVKCQLVRVYSANYSPCIAVTRDGVAGKSSGSLDLLPLTDSAFTAASFGNSNFVDGLPIQHRSTTN